MSENLTIKTIQHRHNADLVIERVPVEFGNVFKDRLQWIGLAVDVTSMDYSKDPKHPNIGVKIRTVGDSLCVCMHNLDKFEELLRSILSTLDKDDLEARQLFANVVTGVESQHLYLQRKGIACPNCGSTDLKGGSVDVDGGLAMQDIGCDCGASWNDVYVLDGYTEFEAPEMAL